MAVDGTVTTVGLPYPHGCSARQHARHRRDDIKRLEWRLTCRIGSIQQRDKQTRYVSPSAQRPPSGTVSVFTLISLLEIIQWWYKDRNENNKCGNPF